MFHKIVIKPSSDNENIISTEMNFKRKSPNELLNRGSGQGMKMDLVSIHRLGL